MEEILVLGLCLVMPAEGLRLLSGGPGPCLWPKHVRYPAYASNYPIAEVNLTA